MSRPIAVGLDGSPESLAAADWAAEESLVRGLPLHLVNAWLWPSYTAPDDAGGSVRKYWAERVLREAETGLRDRRPGLEITTEQLPGHPVTVLRDTADKAELLVLGSRGIGAVQGFLLGSVSLQTLARTERPVVLVRAGDRALDARPLRSGEHTAGVAEEAGEVVVGLALRRPCEAPIEFAFDAAQRRQAPLRAVHVWRPLPIGGYAAHTLTEMGEKAGAALTEALRPWREKYPTVHVVENVVRDSVSRSLLQAASRAALLVVGRRAHRAPLVMHIGPVTHAALHHAPCPVAVVAHD